MQLNSVVPRAHKKVIEQRERILAEVEAFFRETAKGPLDAGDAEILGKLGYHIDEPEEGHELDVIDLDDFISD